MRVKCLDMKEVESIIADAQEILSHVEFGSLKNGVLTLFCVAWAWKSVASTIIVVCGYGTITNKIRIMTARQIIYSSTIIVLGFIQSFPALLCLASTNIAIILLGIFWGILLGIFWSSTIIGRWFFKELWRSTLRLENFILPGAWEVCKVRKLCLETFSLKTAR